MHVRPFVEEIALSEQVRLVHEHGVSAKAARMWCCMYMNFA